MFDISDEYVVQREHYGSLDGVSEKEAQIRFRRNQSDPNMIVDGVDGVTVFKESEDRYLIQYGGYMHGHLTVTREGVKELGKCLLNGQQEIPDWVISSSKDYLPDWMPSDYRKPEPVVCDVCGKEVSVSDIVRPLVQEEFDRYCPDCWETVG